MSLRRTTGLHATRNGHCSPKRAFVLLLTLVALGAFACSNSSSSDNADSLAEALTNQPDDTTASTTGTAPTSSTTDRGERILGIDVTEATDGDFEAALAHAQSTGFQTLELSVYWDEIETSPGTYDPQPNWLEIANAYYPGKGVQVALTISVIDTTQARLPADLAGRSLDDPELIERFNDLLDYVGSQTGSLSIVSLAIGNEVDIYLGDSDTRWNEFEQFFQQASDHARTLWSNVPVGTKVTFDGITGRSAARVQALNKHADVVLATYYPLTDQFQVRPTASVHEDFSSVVAAFPDKPIYFLELGYPSGEETGSSEELQAEFVRQVFLAWDDQAEHIQLITYTWLTDISPEAAQDYSRYYGIDDGAFVSYLATLGLRTSDGLPKLAFTQFTQETEKRGW